MMRAACGAFVIGDTLLEEPPELPFAARREIHDARCAPAARPSEIVETFEQLRADASRHVMAARAPVEAHAAHRACRAGRGRIDADSMAEGFARFRQGEPGFV